MTLSSITATFLRSSSGIPPITFLYFCFWLVSLFLFFLNNNDNKTNNHQTNTKTVYFFKSLITKKNVIKNNKKNKQVVFVFHSNTGYHPHQLHKNNTNQHRLPPTSVAQKQHKPKQATTKKPIQNRTTPKRTHHSSKCYHPHQLYKNKNKPKQATTINQSKNRTTRKRTHHSSNSYNPHQTRKKQKQTKTSHNKTTNPKHKPKTNTPFQQGQHPHQQALCYRYHHRRNQTWQ